MTLFDKDHIQQYDVYFFSGVDITSLIICFVCIDSRNVMDQRMALGEVQVIDATLWCEGTKVAVNPRYAAVVVSFLE